MRSNSLDVVGNLMVVAYQTQTTGMRPAGFEIFDVQDPVKPRSIAFFDASGPSSPGVHHLSVVDGSYAPMSAGAADFLPRNRRDHQLYRIMHVGYPTRPVQGGRWWL